MWRSILFGLWIYLVQAIRKGFVRTTTVSKLGSDILATSQIITQRRVGTPEILDLNLESHQERIRQAEYVVPTVDVSMIKGIIYCPWHNVLLTKSRHVLLESIGTQIQAERFSFRRLYMGKVEKISGICSIIRASTSDHTNNYSHTLIDNMARLWALIRSDLAIGQEINLLFGSEPTALESFLLKKILPANFSIVVLNERKLYECERVLFAPVIVQRGTSGVPKEYADFLVSKLGPQRSRHQVNCIYISRAKRGIRSVVNEDQLIEALAGYGFKPYTLELLPMEQEIDLFYDAEFIIGPYGAGMANIIFSEKAKIIELFPDDILKPHYYLLSKCLDHHYLPYFGKRVDAKDNFEVDISKVLSLVETLANRKSVDRPSVGSVSQWGEAEDASHVYQHPGLGWDVP